jgi:hypothetical protein
MSLAQNAYRAALCSAAIPGSSPPAIFFLSEWSARGKEHVDDAMYQAGAPD